MLANLWCRDHGNLIRKEAPAVDRLLLAARLVAAFSQHERVLQSLYHDPFVSGLVNEARFHGILMATDCVCCVLGDDVVKELCAGAVEPLPSPVKNMRVV